MSILRKGVDWSKWIITHSNVLKKRKNGKC
uniref:Uncharacterized protein n=1 Tax=Podoviridae sp. ctARy1 TaxID=2825228 RepID=A0A8S5TSN9_9CAUD|nr:MAG TPA: hypothetical protein [Podoviridae sp. ctARy1]